MNSTFGNNKTLTNYFEAILTKNSRPDHSHHEMTDCNFIPGTEIVFGDISKISSLQATPLPGGSVGEPMTSLIVTRKRRKMRLNKKGY